MKRNGMFALDFHSPALVGGQITFLHGQQCVGQMVVLSFLPRARHLSADAIDHYAGQLQRIGATLLIVSSSADPLHRLWID